MFDKCKLCFVTSYICLISESLQCNHVEEGRVREQCTMRIKRAALQGGPGQVSPRGDLDSMGKWSASLTEDGPSGPSQPSSSRHRLTPSQLQSPADEVPSVACSRPTYQVGGAGVGGGMAPA